ncbi:MAG: serine/threonine-protein kinase [Myxococcota bacterium]|jgi:serine/threonine-protein kinase|nr:serine/threonine-protein kinase [Myxococcota bacterium]
MPSLPFAVPESVDPASTIAAGTIVGGQYQILELIASGGMGYIYKAVQHPSGRHVAVKVMRSRLMRDATAIKRFRAEAKAAAQLSHRNSITLFDFGESNGLLYMAMEWLDGPNLGTLVTKYGPMSPIRVARIGTAVARALADAHEKGIIHRDLKPENVVLIKGNDDSPYHVKVLDFGIAKMISGDAQTQITQLGHVCGTPEFMSPEQARGDDLDGRSDIYSLGCMLYTLLTTFAPFPGESPMRIVLKHLTEPFPPLPLETPELLAATIRRATQKDPNLRFEDALKMAESLDRFIMSSGLSESDPYLQAQNVSENESFFTEISIPSAVAVSAAPTLSLVKPPAPLPAEVELEESPSSEALRWLITGILAIIALALLAAVVLQLL